MSEDLIHQITLDCLVNKDIYEKMQYTDKNKLNKKEKKFYRKRILNLTKDLLLKKDINYDEINPDIKNSFDNFIKTSIHYFKTIDKNDILQEDYKEFNLLNDTLDDINNNILDNQMNSAFDEQDNRLFMRSIKIKNGLDSFVKIKSIKKAEEIILPKLKEINLQDPNLRNKGIQKKENININYDENKKQNKK
jgi:hypothetical protein